MMAQSIELLANHIEQSTGYQLTPVTYAELPMAAQAGMIACVTDSTARVIGNVVGGGGTNTVLAWCNGAQWLVLGGGTVCCRRSGCRGKSRLNHKHDVYYDGLGVEFHICSWTRVCDHRWADYELEQQWRNICSVDVGCWSGPGLRSSSASRCGSHWYTDQI
jgi:hypothetical protein